MSANAKVTVGVVEDGPWDEPRLAVLIEGHRWNAPFTNIDNALASKSKTEDDIVQVGLPSNVLAWLVDQPLSSHENDAAYADIVKAVAKRALGWEA